MRHIIHIIPVIHFSIIYFGFIYTIIIINVFSLQAKSTTVFSTKQTSLQFISLALVRAKSQGTIPKLHNSANIDKVEIGNVHLFIVSFTWAVPTSLESNSCSIPSKLSFVAHTALIEFDDSKRDDISSTLCILTFWIVDHIRVTNHQKECSSVALSDYIVWP